MARHDIGNRIAQLEHAAAPAVWRGVVTLPGESLEGAGARFTALHGYTPVLIVPCKQHAPTMK